MFRKKLYILCVAVVLSMVTQVLAQNVWTNTTGDGKWGTAANWSEGIVPTMTPDSIGDPRIIMAGANACTIDGTQPQAVCQWLSIGNSFGENGTLNVVAGGKIGTPLFGPGETWIGANGGIGILSIDGAGSIAKSEGWRIGAAASGSAVVNITNGGVLQSGTQSWGNYIHATATVNIINGTMVILGGGPFDINDGGVIKISGTSTFTWAGDHRTQINGYIVAGKIASPSSCCPLVVSYVGLMTNVAVAGGCTCTTYSPGDFNHDCYVDFLDFADFASQWLSCTDPLNAACSQ
ncbi:MAG: Type V secretory pathway, adhesin AidA [Parcubacteria group bacterium GW2011_GWA2_43_17]|nr:MAG: Type V secretory pathway, adhesin AidA [Parcubacteria group bacterium GW2011_GWA2_43_17]OHB42840.1 MAG: hypothetical protein A2Y13_11395 [Planctomycetes bacterium GWC2_45_44]